MPIKLYEFSVRLFKIAMLFLILMISSCKGKTKEYEFAVFNKTNYDLDNIGLHINIGDNNCNLSVPANDTLTNIKIKFASKTNFVNDDFVVISIKEYSLGEDEFTTQISEWIKNVEELSTSRVNNITIQIDPNPDNPDYIFDASL